MNTPKILTVCIAGAEADVVKRLASLLDEQRARLDLHWQPGTHAGADLLVIEADSLYGHMDWLKANASGRLVANWTSAPDNGDGQLRLHKPILVDDLVNLLNRVSAQVTGSSPARTDPSKAAPSTRPAADATAKQAERAAPQAAEAPPKIADRAAEIATPSPLMATTNEAATINPSAPRGMQLVDLLESDSPLKGRLRLAADGLPTLFLDPYRRTWHTESSLKALTPWCSRALSSRDVQSAEDDHFPADTAKMTGQPYARLKWLAFLVSGEGQLDPSLDANARYKLARWPQSEREFPKHFRIATMMLKQASTLDEIAAQSGATIGEVADFINGYHAIGYIEHDQVESAQDDTRRGGLFGRNRKISTN